MKYFRTDLTRVKETNRGGRLHSAVANVELPNGVLGYLGTFIEGSTEVRNLVAPTAALIKTKLPVIVMKPEVNPDQTTTSRGALGLFKNPANKAVPVVPLTDLDNIDLSLDYLDVTGKSGAVAKGDIFVLQANLVAGTQLKYAATAPAVADAGHYFRVIGVRNSHIAAGILGDGTNVATSYKIIELELVSQL